MAIIEDATTRQDRYLAAIYRLIAQRDRLTHEQVRRLYELLDDVRRDVVLDLASLAFPTASSFHASQLRSLKDAIDRAALDLVQRYRLILAGALDAAWEQGSVFQLAALDVIGIQLTFRAINRQRLVIVQELAADLATKVGAEFVGQARGIISRGVMGAISLHAIQRQTTAILMREPGRSRRNVAWHAEVIVRQEMLEAFALADEVRTQEITDEVPGLRKIWDTAGDRRVRPSHVTAGNRYDEAGSIPVKQEFVVGGVQCSGPHDPKLPSRERVLCRCVKRLWKPEWGRE